MYKTKLFSLFLITSLVATTLGSSLFERLLIDQDTDLDNSSQDEDDSSRSSTSSSQEEEDINNSFEQYQPSHKQYSHYQDILEKRSPKSYYLNVRYSKPQQAKRMSASDEKLHKMAKVFFEYLNLLKSNQLSSNYKKVIIAHLNELIVEMRRHFAENPEHEQTFKQFFKNVNSGGGSGSSNGAISVGSGGSGGGGGSGGFSSGATASFVSASSGGSGGNIGSQGESTNGDLNKNIDVTPFKWGRK
jgi:hypothetical protein